MTAHVAATSPVSSNDGNGDSSFQQGDGGSYREDDYTQDGSDSLTSSLRIMRNINDGRDNVYSGGLDGSTLDGTGSTSVSSSIQMRGGGMDASTSSGSFTNELSLPSSFAPSREGSFFSGADDDVHSRTQNFGRSREMLEGINSQSLQPDEQQDVGTSAMKLYDRQGSQLSSDRDKSAGGDEDNDLNSEDQLALRISKETKPMMHLLRLLKEMDGLNGGSHQTGSNDPKERARASLISDFEREMTLIEHRIKDENLIMNGEQMPLPRNWIALEDPDSGDIYYANEATGETQWERPGLITELEEKMEDMKSSDICNNYEGNMMNSNGMNNNVEDSTMQGSSISKNFDDSAMHRKGDNYKGSVVQKGHMTNNHEVSAMQSSSTNNFEEQSNTSEGTCQKSIATEYTNSETAQRSNNFDGSHSNMSNTLESSLTDSNNAQDLPPNWIALEDQDSGEAYYANELTGETTWDKPTMPQSLEEETNGSGDIVDNDDDNLPPDWIALEDADSGDTYYLNQVTMATTWDRPGKGNSDSEKWDGARETDQDSQLMPEGDDDDNEDDDTTNDSGSNLPSGWEAVFDSLSGDYYYAHEDGETRWERPVFPRQSNTPDNDDVDEVDIVDKRRGHPGNKDSANDLDLQDEDNLPPGWFSVIDESSGDRYYCNEVTGETMWDFPTRPATSSPTDHGTHDEISMGVEDGDPDDNLPPGWFAVADPSSGDLYYVHEESGETTWDRPRPEESPGTGNEGMLQQHLMSRLSINDTTVYEDDSVTSSHY